MTESLTTYQGNCHCGLNRYEVQLPDLPSLVICGCSLCAKQGYVWVYGVEDKLNLTRGCTPETLTTYTSLHSGALTHEFCTSCGTGLFGTHASGAQAGKRGINLRPIVSGMSGIFVRGTEVITLGSAGESLPYPGSLSFVETSATPRPTSQFRGTLPEATNEHTLLYTGGCDCDAVQIALRTKPLDEVEIKEDNCSICIRNGGTSVYPHRSQVALVGKELTEDYRFGRKFNGSPFCRNCGVHCFGNLYGPPQAIVDRLPEAKKEFVRRQLEIQPLNVKVLGGVHWDTLGIKWENEGTDGYVLGD